MPYHIFKPVYYSFFNQGEICAPPSVEIKLGSYPVNVLDAKKWTQGDLIGFFYDKVAFMPSFEQHVAELQKEGIVGIKLSQNENASIVPKEIVPMQIRKAKTTLTTTLPSSLCLGERLVENPEKGLISLTHVSQISDEKSASYFEDVIPGIKAGDYLIHSIALSKSNLGAMTLDFNMPLTLEAFEKCENVLKVLVKKEYLTIAELNALRGLAMENTTIKNNNTGKNLTVYRASPLPPVDADFAEQKTSLQFP